MTVLYLHGLASGLQSTKGTAFDRHFAARDIALERLDLRVPSLPHLRMSAMLEVVRARLATNTAIIGSSLGGLVAARVAEHEPRITALVLLAPAFRLVERWRARLGPAWDDWRRTGWLDITDFTTGEPARLDYGFIEELERLDVGWPDVRVPTLILHGTRDEIVPIEHSRGFASDRANVRLIELEDGHDLTGSLPIVLAEATCFLRQSIGA